MSPNLPDGVGPRIHAWPAPEHCTGSSLAYSARVRVETLTRDDALTWADLLRAAVFDALAADERRLAARLHTLRRVVTDWLIDVETRTVDATS